MHTTDDSWDIQTALMEHLEGAWQQPDNGLWEIRGPRQHFTYSKVMAWVAADRMVDAVETSGLSGPVDRWRALRDTIKTEVLDRGYDDQRGTFVAGYGTRTLDASRLLGWVGFLSHDDPRILGTLAAGASSPSTGSSCVTALTTAVTAYRRAKGCSWPARSGWSTPYMPAAARTQPSPSTSGFLTCETTSGCSVRSGTRSRSVSSATPRRRSATSRS